MATKTPSMTLQDSIAAPHAAGIQVPACSKIAQPKIAEEPTRNKLCRHRLLLGGCLKGGALPLSRGILRAGHDARTLLVSRVTQADPSARKDSAQCTQAHHMTTSW
jgi:hypothetical protein